MVYNFFYFGEENYVRIDSFLEKEEETEATKQNS